MKNHWHIVYVTNPCEEVRRLFETAGMPVKFPIWNRNYKGNESEAFGYCDKGRGVIQNAQLDCLVFQDNSWLHSLRQLVPPEAQTQLVLITGKDASQSNCFKVWQQHIQPLVTIVAPCPTCKI